MRGGYTIKPMSGENQKVEHKSVRSNLLEEFARKIAVQPVREESSGEEYYSRMYAIMNGHRPNTRYSSVEEAVKDYQKKTGLEDYLKTIKAEEAAKKIVKSAEVSVFVKYPYLKSFVDAVIARQIKFKDNKVMTALSELEQNFPNISQQELHASDLKKYISDQLKDISDDISGQDVHMLSSAITAPIQEVNDNDPFKNMRK
jgi:hypothetical protein